MKSIIDQNKSTYNALANEYDMKVSVRKSYNSGLADRFIEFITTGKEVLDIGCAVGLDLENFREKGFLPTGIELSEEMAKLARLRNPGTNIIEGNFMELDINKKFDAVWALSFIHLFPEKEVPLVLEKIKDYLKPGGVMYITTTKSQESKEGWVEKTDYQGGYKRFRKDWTYPEIVKSLEKAKFSIVDYRDIEDPYHKLHM